MINPHDSIKLTNVVSRKYHFHYKDMELSIADFINDLVKLGVTIKGPLVYSLHNVPMDEMMNVEFYMPIEEDHVQIPDNMSFQSYFLIDNMISTVDLVNEEASTEAAYAKLINYIEENHLQQATPIFHVVSGDQTLQYVFIKIGVWNK